MTKKLLKRSTLIAGLVQLIVVAWVLIFHGDEPVQPIVGMAYAFMLFSGLLMTFWSAFGQGETK